MSCSVFNIKAYLYNFFCKGLNTLIEELDKRYEEKVKRDGGTMPRKERKQGHASTSMPPVDAPKWAVITGQWYHDCFCILFNLF